MKKPGVWALLAALCASGVPIAPLPAQAAGSASCSASINATVGTYDPLFALSTGITRAAKVRVTCGIFGLSAGQSYQVTVDIASNGHLMQNASSPAQTLKYDVYFPDGKMWVDGTAGSAHYVAQFTASGTRTIPVEIRVPAGQDASVGTYSDAAFTFIVTTAGPI